MEKVTPRSFHAADGCFFVIAEDGSVWKRAQGETEWKRILDAVAKTPKFKRRLMTVGGRIVASSADGSLACYDSQANSFVAPKNGRAPAISGEVVKCPWKLRKASNGTIELASNEGLPWTNLSEFFSIKRIAVDKSRLYLQSGNAVYALDQNKTADYRIQDITAPEWSGLFNKPSPFAFDGLNFKCEVKKAGDWTTVEQGITLRLIRKTAPGYPAASTILRPHVADKRFGFAHQWIGDVCFDHNNMLVSISNGIMLLRTSKDDRSGADYQVVKRFRFSGTGRSFPIFGAVNGDIFCRGGLNNRTAIKWNRAKLTWERTGSAMPDDAFASITAPVRHGSRLGPICSLPDSENDAASGKLVFTFNQGNSVTGQCGPNGFDFDRVVAIAMDDGKGLLHTQAGLIEFNSRQIVGKSKEVSWLPTTVDVAAACGSAIPAASYKVYRDALPGYPHILLGRGTNEGWSFDGRRWANLTAELIGKLEDEENELLHEGTFCRWRRDDTVELQCRHEKGPAKTMLKAKFDADLGRFDFDQVSAIGYLDHNAWALTRRGIVQPLEDGTIRVFDLPDGGDPVTDARFFVLHGGNGVQNLALKLTTTDDNTHWLLWQQTAWKTAPDSGDIHYAIQNIEDTLLVNAHWKVSRSEINAVPVRTLQRHWPWDTAGVFDTVTIDMDHESFPARFDFERISDFAVLDDHLWIATGHGILLYKISTRRFIGRDKLSEQSPGVETLFLRDGAIFASSDSNLFRNNSNKIKGWSRYKDRSPPQEDNPSLLDSANWKIVSGDNGTDQGISISHRLAEGDKRLVDVELAADGGGLRFDFDTVTSVAGSGQTVALVARMGLIERPDSDIGSLKRASSRAGDLPKDADCEVFQFGPEGSVSIYCESGGKLWRQDDQSEYWTGVETGEAARIKEDRSSIAAWNAFWQIHNMQSEQFSFTIGMPQDKNYLPTAFNAEKGLFDFDIMHDAASLVESNRAEEVFVATDDGVVRRGIDTDGPWERRYCNLDIDGIAPNAIYDLAGNGSPVIMLKKASGNGFSCRTYHSEEDLWVKSDNADASAELFAVLESLHQTASGGWTVADIKSHNWLSPTRSAAAGLAVGLEHHDQPIWLIDTESGLLCAHDVVYNLDFHQDRLWLATAGGCLSYPVSGGAWQSDMGVKSAQHLVVGFLPSYDIWNPSDPPNVGFLEKSAAGDALVCFLLDKHDSIRDARYDTQTSFVILPAHPDSTYSENTSRLSPEEAATTLHVLNSPLWWWTKSGPFRFDMGFHEDAADLPRNYTMLADGAFRFFDISRTKDRKKMHRATELSPQLLYVATVGGVIAFDSHSGEPRKLFAQSETGSGSGTREIKSVRRLFYNDRDDSLTAEDDSGSVFRMACDESGHFATIAVSSSDPFADANILVDNSLLQWRQESDKAHIRLTNSDLPEDANYQFFIDGQFSFDHVNELTSDDRGNIYFATSGGVVRATADTRKIEYIYARDFLGRSKSGLANVSEIIFDRNCPDPSLPKIHARDGGDTWSMLANDSWRRDNDRQPHEAFRREYTRLSDPFWSWVRHPSGISVQLHKSEPAGALFGDSMLLPHDSLMSRGRFRWDDLREVELRDNDVFFTTPTGICHYRYQSVDVPPQFIKLYTQASHVGHENIPMRNVERILGENGRLIAWNDRHVFTAKKVSASEGWRWEVDHGRKPEEMTRRSVFHDQADGRWQAGGWGLQFDEKTKQLALHRMKSEANRESFGDSKKICTKQLAHSDVDCSRAIATPAGIFFQARGEDVVWFNTRMAKHQKACRSFAWVGAVVAIALFFWFLWPALRRTTPSKSPQK